MKRTLSMLLLCLLLIGCGAEMEAPPPLPTGDAPPPIVKSAGRELQADIYYVTSSGGEYLLMPEQRVMSLPEGATEAEAILLSLMEEPTNPALKTPFGNWLPLELDRAEFSGDNCLVYFNYAKDENIEESIKEEDILIMKACVAETMYHAFGMEYTDVYIGNTQPGSRGRPVGALKHPGTDQDVRRLQIPPGPGGDLGETPVEVRDAPLYYTDSLGELLVCETRALQYAADSSIHDILAALLRELLEGPSGGAGLAHVLPRDMRYSSSAFQMLENISKEEEGAPPVYSLVPGEVPTTTMVRMDNWGWLSLYFQGNSTAFDEKLAYGAIVSTVTSFIPRLMGVRIFYNDREVAVHEVMGREVPTEDSLVPKSFVRTDFSDMIGHNILLYYPEGDGLGLVRETGFFTQAELRDSLYYLQKLLDGHPDQALGFGPLAGEDILSVSVQGSLAVVNTRAGFLGKLSALVENAAISPVDAARLYVFSMVNTLGDMRGIDRVQFLEEGKRIMGSVGGTEEEGRVYLGNPLFENPGLMAE